MATDEVNAAGGVKGKKVRVLFEDDKSNAQEASNKVLQLIDRDKVIAHPGRGRVEPLARRAGSSPTTSTSR